MTDPKRATYQPDLYDLVTPASLDDDVAWYVRKGKEADGPVLELGAGTGRVTLALARAGVGVHALDAHPGMLHELRRKVADLPADTQRLVAIVEADMRTFQLNERFALVIAPFRAILHNLTDGDLLACFGRVRRHLREGGRFAFNVFHPSLEIMSRHAGPLTGVWRWVGTFDRPDGGWVIRSEANRFEIPTRRIHSLHRYEEFDADGILHRTTVHRLELTYLYPPDIHRLLEQAGFKSVAIAGGFRGAPFQDDTDELVVEAVA
jgi:SAM-dependent methyltransferase